MNAADADSQGVVVVLTAGLRKMNAIYAAVEVSCRPWRHA